MLIIGLTLSPLAAAGADGTTVTLNLPAQPLAQSVTELAN